MKYFFDNNLSPHLAHAIQELCRVEKTVARAIHLRDVLRFECHGGTAAENSNKFRCSP
ncbi:hypothetical protein LJR029_005465 [Caballeronia sp. LjRoot29]|jgi:hypothetical protein|uniref:hypothetical protein n=1 Tax=unclassified Caballeronia TaxID=2646786 RepID=UPI0039E5A14C